MAKSGKGTFNPVRNTTTLPIYVNRICILYKCNLIYFVFIQDSDVHISYEDQQKINKFARLNAKVDDIKDELKVKQNDMKNFEEAVEELSLADDSEKIPYLVGEVFFCQSLEDTLVCRNDFCIYILIVIFV